MTALTFKLTKGSIEGTAAQSDVSEEDLKLLLERGKNYDRTVFVRIEDGVLTWTWVQNYIAEAHPDIRKKIENAKWEKVVE